MPHTKEMRTLPIPTGLLLIVPGERLINHIRFAIFHTSENTLALALNNQNGHGFSAIDLPPGSWSIVGWSDELTEEQCEKIVKGRRLAWLDYKSGIHWEMWAHKSFASLLRSHGITDRALIIKKEK